MIFRPELAAKVLAGEKTVTRRLPSVNPRSPWYRGRCALEVGRVYAVQPGRGIPSVARVRVLMAGWAAINGTYRAGVPVWRVEFVLEAPGVIVSQFTGMSSSEMAGMPYLVESDLMKLGIDRHRAPGIARAQEAYVRSVFDACPWWRRRKRRKLALALAHAGLVRRMVEDAHCRSAQKGTRAA